MTYKEIWLRIDRCCACGEGEAKAVARILLDDMFGLSLTDILCGAVEQLAPEAVQRLESAVARLEKGEPVQYVTAVAPFCGRTFHVEPGVLIPRPETEQLCRLAAGAVAATPHARVLDIGTGSGCIAATIALECPEAEVEAFDISPDALRIAAANARRLGADVRFRLQDALSLPDDTDRWHLVVSNPPYICRSEESGMERNVLSYEPHLALFVPDDAPLLFYRAIARYAAHALKPGGWLMFEINPLYAAATEDMLHSEGFAAVETIKDIYGKERNTICRRQ